MGLVRRREGIFGLCLGCCQDAPGEGSTLAVAVMPRAGLGASGVPPVWGGAEHVPSLTALLISQRYTGGDGHQSQPESKADALPPTLLPSCCRDAPRGGKGQGTARGNRAPLINKPFRSGFMHPQRA